MAEISDVQLGFGAIAFRGGVAAEPASVVRQGNVTVHNEAKPGQPMSFEGSFQISCYSKEDAISLFNVFTVNLPVVGEPADSPYSAIESKAARQIAPMLRSIADEVERQIAEAEGTVSE